MAKEISEKTFELNITHELLQRSSQFLDFLTLPGVIKSQLCLNHWFLKKRNGRVLFAEGLSTRQEGTDNNKGSGYDISIKINDLDMDEPRIIFMQFKSGEHQSDNNRSENSKFNSKNVQTQEPCEHVKFEFNNNSRKDQHRRLKELAGMNNINPDSVMYVFPRITKREKLFNSVGNLIERTSFITINELDQQARQAGIDVEGNNYLDYKHYYRTSYDGTKSEVNYYYYYYYYYGGIPYDLLSEIILVQIERLLKFAFRTFGYQPMVLKEFILDAIWTYEVVEKDLIKGEKSESLYNLVKTYLMDVSDRVHHYQEIKSAPSKYTTIIPKGGLKMQSISENNFSEISYQIF